MELSFRKKLTLKSLKQDQYRWSARPLYIAIISYTPQIHQIAFTVDMCQVNGWETLSLQLLSRIFDERDLAGSSYGKLKEDYNPLDYFRMRIQEEISFFFL